MASIHRKVTIVGAGNVGGTTAQRLAERNLVREIILVDVVEDLAIAKALDLSQTGPLLGYDVQIQGTGDFEDTKGSDIVVITSGVPRKPGMSRDDLLSINANIVKTVAEKATQASPDSILIVVSNPLDAMAHVACRVSGFPRERVIGMAGVLDSARMSSFIASEMGVSVESVQAMVLGGHGDSMVPLISYTTIAGVPIRDLLPREKLEDLIRRTRDAGAEIVKLLKIGSAYFAPSAAIVEMITSILQDKKKILPCAVLCQGEYGIQDLFVGVPAKLGRKGMEGIIEYELNSEEKAELKRSTEGVRELKEAVNRLVKL